MNDQKLDEARAMLQRGIDGRGADWDEHTDRLFRDTLQDAVGDKRSEQSVFRPMPGDGIGGFDRGDGGGIPREELRKFSLGRAIAAAATGDWRQAGFERELSDHVTKRGRKETRGGLNGFWWPISSDREQRDITIGTESADIMQTDFGEPIDLLINKMQVAAAGATVLTGLVGDRLYPKLTAAGTGGWVAESGAPSESTQTFGQVKLVPKTVIAYTDISRQTLLQSNFDMERFITRDLTRVLAIAFDLAALHGTGASNQPTGLIGISNIGDVAGGTNGAAPTWAHITSLEEEVSIDNGDFGKLAYITNPKVRRKLKTTLKNPSGTDGTFVWGGNDTPLNDYPTFVTNQVASNLVKGTSGAVCSAIFFGNWEEMLLGFWSDVDVLVDPYTGGTSGTVRVITYLTADIQVRHPESFAAIKDVLTT